MHIPAEQWVQWTGQKKKRVQYKDKENGKGKVGSSCEKREQ